MLISGGTFCDLLPKRLWSHLTTVKSLFSSCYGSVCVFFFCLKKIFITVSMVRGKGQSTICYAPKCFEDKAHPHVSLYLKKTR